ncbi:hypothetical protein [Paraprevotella clara]|uniref:hypothetical protein n=1 Tax=Paraprevotella clara TaxID=454154 RepID=UPI0026703FAB|nr:hypothetical protein [Paraprevotella clara]
MKARIKSNGHIVNVHETGERVISKNGIERTYISDDCSGIYYTQSELEFLQTNDEDTIDRNQVRIRAAIAAMQGILSDEDEVGYACSEAIFEENEKHTIPKAVARFVVACADDLVEELKKSK